MGPRLRMLRPIRAQTDPRVPQQIRRAKPPPWPPRSTNALRRRQPTPQVDGREVGYFYEVTLTCVDTPDDAAVSTSRQNECVVNVQAALAAQANPEKAQGMRAYMKTDMPFYGVQSPDRKQILRFVVSDCRPSDRDEYDALVSALWALPHREEKYIAQGVARAHKRFIVPASLPLYERMITEGAWWDLVDETATDLIRPLVVGYPQETWQVVDGWISDEDIWLRRAALICQIGAKEATDAERLFRFCEVSAHETEFFIRKAIGWALREHAKTDPQAVAGFVTDRRDTLSGLSFREATKHIGELVG